MLLDLAPQWWLLYLVIGALVGVLAGLLGIGGGVTMVPIFLLVMPAHGVVTPQLMQTVLATSMCIVMFTAMSSMRAHHQKGGVMWGVVWTLIPAIALGNVLGAQIMHWLPSKILMKVFALFTIYMGISMLMQKPQVKPRGLPGKLGMWSFGIALGLVCTLVSAGGAFMTVPFLTYAGIPMASAIGTAAAMGFPIAVISSIAAVIAGWSQVGIPSPHLGYIYLPAVIACATGSMLTAPFGARLSHRLPVQTLKRVFATLMFGIALKMLHSAFFN
jgi:uncharacterized protein